MEMERGYIRVVLQIISVCLLVVSPCEGQSMKYKGFAHLRYGTEFRDYGYAVPGGTTDRDACHTTCKNYKEVTTDGSECLAFQFCPASLHEQGTVTGCYMWLGEQPFSFTANTTDTGLCDFFYKAFVPSDTYDKYSMSVEYKYYLQADSSGTVYEQKQTADATLREDHVNRKYRMTARISDLYGLQYEFILNQTSGYELTIVENNMNCHVINDPYNEPSQEDKDALELLAFTTEPLNLKDIDIYRTQLDYQGTESKRGIATNVFSRPIDKIGSEPVLNGKRTYYFTKPWWEDEVDDTFNLHEVPVVIESSGEIVDRDSGRRLAFRQRYDITQYRHRHNNEWHFESPSGLFCVNKKLIKPVPSLPDHFRSRMQLVITVESPVPVIIVEEAAAWYDYVHQLSRYDFRLPNGLNLPSTILPDPYSIIHDFNTGVAYTIDQELLNCSVGYILDGMIQSDINLTSPGVVHLLQADHMLQYHDTDLQYRGPTYTRGIPTEAWVAYTDEFHGYYNQTSRATMEFRFLRTDSDNVQTYGKSLPMYLDVTSYTEDDLRINLRYHYFATGEVEPDIRYFDISTCFAQSEKLEFVITFKAPSSENAESLISSRKNSFLKAVRQSINDLTKASPIRMQGMELHFDNDKVEVLVTLLEQLPAGVTLQIDAVPETPSRQVYGEVRAAVSAGTLTVTESSAVFTATAVMGPNVPPVDPTPTAPSTDGDRDGYTAGAMAGLAIGMLLTGLLIGVGVIMFLRSRGRSFV